MSNNTVEIGINRATAQFLRHLADELDAGKVGIRHYSTASHQDIYTLEKTFSLTWIELPEKVKP